MTGTATIVIFFIVRVLIIHFDWKTKAVLPDDWHDGNTPGP